MGTEFKIFSIVFMFLTIESEEKEKKNRIQCTDGQY